MELSDIKKARRVVIKVGSSVLRDNSRIKKERISRIARETATLISSGKEVLIVSSGAILFGREIMGVKGKTLSMKEKQALSAVGQVLLMEAYRKVFERCGLKTAQILLTHADFEDPKRWKNSEKTLEELISMKVVPVINENDTVSTEEIKIGDNDHLSAMVSVRMGADLLLILTNIPCVYTTYMKDGKKVRVPVNEVRNEEELEELMRSAKGASSPETVGGMNTKLKAARMGMKAGIWVVIADGRRKGCISSIKEGIVEGTIFHPSGQASSAKKFILSIKNEKGEIVIDEGAIKAIVEEKKSLLPVGVIDVRGKFPEKSVVRLLSRDGKVIGRGRVNMDSETIRKIMGKRTWEIAGIMKKGFPNEVIHRDYMIFFV